MDDQLQLDRHLIDFFEEARSVSLTHDEKETMRFAMETLLMEKSVSPSPAARLQEYMTHGRESSQFTDHFLADKEKRQLRKNLVSFMQQNPRYVSGEVVEEAVQSFSLFRMFEIAVPRLALGLMLFVGLGAGVSFASQTAIPGDFLYPFKVGVYEPVVSRLAVSDESRAAWESKRARNRLVEAEALAAESRLTEKHAAELRIQFNNHLNAAQKNIEMLNANGDTDVALSIQAGLETYLDSHSSAVRDIALKEEGDASASAAAAVTAKQPGSNTQNHSKSSGKNSLVEKVQTILSLPVVVSSSSSSETRESSVSSANAKSSSSKSKENAASSKKNDPSSSSKKNEKSSSSGQSSVTTFSISSAPDVEAASSASLVSDLFDDIMEAASSAMTIPDLLPKL